MPKPRGKKRGRDSLEQKQQLEQDDLSTDAVVLKLNKTSQEMMEGVAALQNAMETYFKTVNEGVQKLKQQICT
jgi:hypothetical protein